jgi:hypothetical protein
VTADSHAPDLRATHERQFAEDLQAFVDRHEAIYRRVGDIDEDLWSSRVSDVIFSHGKEAATDFGRLMYQLLSDRTASQMETRFRPEFMDPWIDEVSENVGKAMVAGMIADLAVNQDADDMFDRYRTTATLMAVSLTTSFAQFGAHDGATAAGARNKMWHVNSANPRSSHAALDGETVPLGQSFSNGMRWPGDRSGGVDETAGCQCSLTFTKGR